MLKKSSDFILRFFKKRSFFFTLTAVYLSILILVSILTCMVSYNQRKQAFLATAEATWQQLKKDYTETLDNFWQIYIPVVDNNSSIYPTLTEYFSTSPKSPLMASEITALKEAMSQIMVRDSQVQWVAFYSPYREDNYIMFNTTQAPTIYSEKTFPYLDDILDKNGNMEIYPLRNVINGTTTFSTFALCGNTPANMNGGKIIAGYSVTSLDQIYKNSDLSKESLTYTLTINSPLTDSAEIIYRSSSDPNADLSYIPDTTTVVKMKTPDNRHIFIRSDACGSSHSTLSYEILQKDLFFYSHKNTPMIILLVLAFALLSICIYAIMLRFIAREVDTIRNGLAKIGQNHLDYRIPTDFRQSGFEEIAESINQMTRNLNENIERAYYYELKQKESELAELQAKFNPHFLYNSLEMLRSRCYQSGDIQTADLITSLSGIFRGFIGSKTFIPVPEELAFTKKYLTLFGARYQGQVEFEFDIDNECLQYGIIRNLFQPLVENYFVHGFAANNNEMNYIRFRGKTLNQNTLLFIVEDNGTGMTDEELIQLNNKLNEPIKLSTESYGLKNLQQRLQLFYDTDCGLTICHGKPKGLSIQIKVRKLTCAEYEESSRQIRR